jgi:glycosyltransferase involved in cell wall biosynthesis
MYSALVTCLHKLEVNHSFLTIMDSLLKEVYLYLRHFPARGEKLDDGLKKAVHGLASGLAKHSEKVVILSEGSKSENTSFTTDAGYTIQCFANPIQHRPSFQISPALKQYISDNLSSDSLVMLNGILHPSLYSISRLLKKRSVPYVVVPHDIYHPAMFSKNAHLKFFYWHLLEKRMLMQARAIQVLDISQAKWLERRGIQTPIFEVPNGFTPTDVQPESVLSWEVDRKPSFFFFGRLDTYHKGLDLLIDAFSQITDVLDGQLIIQGPDWGDKKDLQQQAGELLSLGKISFLEPEYTRSPSSVIADYDVFCLPSRFEGFGLSALEAMLAGRVLLVSEEAGIATYVRASKCGVVVKPETSAIKLGLLELYNCRSEWKEMGLRGQRYALEHLSWDKIAFAAAKEYRCLIA